MTSAYVRSVGRAIDILFCFDYNTPTMSLGEISERVQLSKSTVHRLLTTLEAKKVIIQDQRTQLYSLAPKLLILGDIFLKSLDIRKIAIPIMEKLNKLTNETVELNIVEGDERVCIEQIQSSEVIRNFIKVGSRNSLLVGSSGKSLLANMETEKMTKIIKDNKDRFSHIHPEKLIDELNQIKKQGYASSFEERLPGAFSFSSPLKNHKSELVAGITVAGPIQRYSDEKATEIVHHLLNCSREISSQLGYKINV